MRLDRGQIEVLDDEMVQVLRRKSGAERLAIASMLRAEHPEWDEHQVNEETARRLSHGNSVGCVLRTHHGCL